MGLEQLFIAKIVLPFVLRVGQGTLSEVYAWLEGNGAKLGHGLGRRLLRRISKGRLGVGDADQLAGDLASYVERHPDATAKLTTAVFQEAGQQGRLEIIKDLLETVFELVKQIGRPVVLPGFITGVDHLAIIDVRTYTADEEYTPPAVHPASGDHVPTITLAGRGAPGWGDANPRPRIWLVTEPKDGERERLDDATENANVVLHWPDQFTEAIQGQLLVTRVTRDDVSVNQAQVTPVGLVVGESDELPWADSASWVGPMVRALREDLEAEDAYQAEVEREFRDALSS